MRRTHALAICGATIAMTSTVVTAAFGGAASAAPKPVITCTSYSATFFYSGDTGSVSGCSGQTGGTGTLTFVSNQSGATTLTVTWANSDRTAATIPVGGPGRKSQQCPDALRNTVKGRVSADSTGSTAVGAKLRIRVCQYQVGAEGIEHLAPGGTFTI